MTRSDFGISRTGASIRIGAWSSTRRFSASTTISRSTTAISPALRSARRCHSSIALNHPHSQARPMPSISSSHETPVKSESPIAPIASRSSVAPVNPKVAWKTWPITAPKSPPGASGRLTLIE